MNRQIVQGALASAVFIVTSILVGVLQFRLVIDFLRPEVAGLWLLFVSVGSYVTFFDLGISPTVGREMSFTLGSKELTEEAREARLAELVITLKQVFRSVALVAWLVAVVVGEVAIIAFSRFRHDRGVQLAWAVFSFGAAINLFGGSALSGLFGLGKVATEKLVRTLSLAAGLLLMLFALMLRWGVLGLAVAWVVQSSIVAVVGWRLLFRRCKGLSERKHRPDWQLAKSLLGPSIKLAFIQLGAILILQSANPIIAIVLGTAAIPPYDALSKVAITLMTLALVIVNSSSPAISVSYSRGEHAEVTNLLVRSLQVGVGLIIVLASFVAVNGERILAVWLGPNLFAGWLVLWTLLVMVLLEVHHVIFASVAMAAGQIVFAWSAVASGILNIVLALILGRMFGLLGIAVAVAVSQLVTNNWYAPFFAIRFFRIPLATLFRQVWGPLGLLLVIELALDAGLSHIPVLAHAKLLPLIGNAILCTAAGLLCWFYLVFRRSERSQLFAAFGRWAKITE